MGEPVRILDLAVQMIRLAGLEPYLDIPIDFIGLRPGEKLHEELYAEGERIAGTGNSRIGRGQLPSRPRREMQRALACLTVLASNGSGDAIRIFLNQFLRDANLTMPSDRAAGARPAQAGGVGH
jgi:O-antigen biosynthesis protein WbqV